MKLNPKIAKTPEDLQDLEFKRMKAMIKRDLKRLEKLTTADKPTQVMIMGEYAYKDKPNGVGLILFGAWKGTWKSYAKNEVAKQNELGAIGAAHFDGIGDDGQKIVTLRLAKGKGKNKHSKLERGLKKLVPQSTYNLVFDEISEEELSTIEQRLDSAPDIDEVFEDADLSDEGEVEVDNNQDIQKLLDSNLKEISATIGTVNAQILPRLQAKAPEEGDGDSIVNLIDLCNEWIELYQEAQDPAIQSANTAGLNKVKEIKGNAEKMLLIGTQQGMTTSKPVVLTEGPDLAKAMTLKGRDLLNTGKYDKKGGQTYCNFFAMDYVDKMIGMELFDRTDWKNSEYLKWVAKNDPNWSLGGCGAMMAFMESRPDAFPPIKTTGPERYEEAWKAANNGKLVLFIDKGHVSVASYTPKLLDYKVGSVTYKIGNVVQAGDSVIKGDKTINYAWTLRTKEGNSTGVLERLKIFIVNKPVKGITGGNNDQNQSDTPVSNDVNSVTATSIRGAVGDGGGNFEDTVVVQRLLKKAGENLGNFGPNKDGIDGDCGNTTINAIKSFQSKKGLEQNGLVMPGNNTWLALTGQPYTQEIGGNTNDNPNPNPNPIVNGPIAFKYQSSAVKLSAGAEAILSDILRRAGETKAEVTSTYRDQKHQMKVMHDNIAKYGVEKQKRLYGSKGDLVIDAYVAAKNAGKNAADIQAAMYETAMKVGFNSKHNDRSNPAIDISPRTVSNIANLMALLNADSRVSKIIPPSDIEPALHIELKGGAVINENGGGNNNQQDNPQNPNENGGQEPNVVTATQIKAPVGVNGGSFEDTTVVQRLLKKAGENLGNFGPNKDGIDGDCGNTTINAIRNFQRKNGLKETGSVEPNSNTWLALNGQPFSKETNTNTQTGGQVTNMPGNIYKAGEKPAPGFELGLSTEAIEAMFKTQAYKSKNCDVASRFMVYRYMEQRGLLSMNEEYLLNSQGQIGGSITDENKLNNTITKGGEFAIGSIMSERNGQGCIQMVKEVNGKHVPTGDWEKAIAYANNKLAKGIPVVAGVSHSQGSANPDGTSDHFLVLVGKAGNEYIYIDPGSSSEGKDIGKNRLVLDKTTSTFKDASGAMSGKSYILTNVAVYNNDRGANWGKWEQEPIPSAEAKLNPEEVKLQIKAKAGLQGKAETILREIFAQTGEDSPMIVSTLRSAEEQASIMYLNLESAGVKLNRKMYKDKAAAGQVIDAYEAAKNAGKPQAEIVGAILAALQSVGAEKISGHCNASNPAIDVHPSSIKNKAQFEAVLKADPRVAKVVCPPKDTTYHIELK